MNLKKLLYIGIFLYWFVSYIIYLEIDGFQTLNIYTILCLAGISCGLLAMIKASNKNTLWICIAIYIYIFTNYLIGTLKFELVFQNPGDAISYNDYIWIKVDDINNWLIYGGISFFIFYLAIIIGDLFVNREIKNNYRVTTDKYVKSYRIIIFICILCMYSTVVSMVSGYGVISNTESNPLLNLYGVIGLDTLIPLSILIFYWSSLSKEKITILCITISFILAAKLIGGSRAFLYNGLIYLILIFAYQYGDIKIKFKYLIFILILFILNLMLYSTALEIKNGITSVGNTYVLELIEGSRSLESSIWHINFKDAISIINRLSDNGASIRIIGNQNYLPFDVHFNIISTIQRLTNDLIPGTVFNNVIDTQQIWHQTFFGESTVYGGENLGMPGIYYVYFGYALGLLFSLLSGIFFILMLRMLAKGRYRWHNILIPYFIVALYSFINNPLFEVWFVVCIYRPFIFILIISIYFRITNLFGVVKIDA